MPDRHRIDLRKRNRLIARLTRDQHITAQAGDDFDLVTPAERAVLDTAARKRDPYPVVSKKPVIGIQGHVAGGGFYVYPQPVIALWEQLRQSTPLSIEPLLQMAPLFVAKSAAYILEHLIRAGRAAADEPSATVDVEDFFDGNGDRSSIAPNIVNSDGGPSFELIRDTLLEIAARRDVAAVGVEIDELPNPDHRGDNDMWPSAGRVFIWTTAAARDVRQWVKPLRVDDIAKVSAKTVSPPDGKAVPGKIKVFEMMWD